MLFPRQIQNSSGSVLREHSQKSVIKMEWKPIRSERIEFLCAKCYEPFGTQSACWRHMAMHRAETRAIGTLTNYEVDKKEWEIAERRRAPSDGLSESVLVKSESTTLSNDKAKDKGEAVTQSPLPIPKKSSKATPKRALSIDKVPALPITTLDDQFKKPQPKRARRSLQSSRNATATRKSHSPTRSETSTTSDSRLNQSLCIDTNSSSGDGAIDSSDSEDIRLAGSHVRGKQGCLIDGDKGVQLLSLCGYVYTKNKSGVRCAFDVQRREQFFMPSVMIAFVVGNGEI